MSGHGPRSDDVLSEVYPHYKTYKLCQQRAFISGSLTLVAAAACTYSTLKYGLVKYIPSLNNNWLTATPMVVGALSAYLVTMSRTTACKNMWMAMEERHSILTPAEERLSERLKSE